MSDPIEIANDIKAAIAELADGRSYPDLLEAVDSLAALAHTGQAAPVALENPTMEDALAAAEGTLHGAIDYWQARARKAEAALAAPAGEVANSPAMFLIYYDDTERRPEIIQGEAGARHRFKQIGWQWNAHLFGKLESNSRDDRHAENNVILATPATEPAAPGYVSVPVDPTQAQLRAATECSAALNGLATGLDYYRAMLAAAASTVQGKEKP